ncbi:hypothetical protein [Phenylobacterium sp.]|uniref:hypothetical protein n=1 Tax=Phenylobacterium sp. TaxID=1871053 RepID=UPI003D27E922
MRLVHALVLIAALLARPALAAPQDAVMNREGYWGIDVDSGACAASMTLQGGSVFLLRALDGEVTFGLLGVRSPVRKGKAGRIETDAGGFDFAPSYGEDAMTLFYAETLDAKALDVLRPARQLRVLIDGAPVAAMTLEGTGFEGALDGVVACSKGQAGWWGKGVVADASDGPVLVYQREGDAWGIVTGETTCLASAAAPDDRQLQLLSVGGRIGIAVGTTTGKLPKGRKARVVTDSYSFEFTPEYSDGATYLNSADLLDSADAFALRRAKALRIVVDGRTVLDVAFDDDSFLQIIDAVTACSRGEKGWWGEGAKPPR